jgi:hypothetical protein
MRVRLQWAATVDVAVQRLSCTPHIQSARNDARDSLAGTLAGPIGAHRPQKRQKYDPTLGRLMIHFPHLAEQRLTRLLLPCEPPMETLCADEMKNARVCTRRRGIHQ